MSTLSSKEKALLAARCADDKKAVDITILEVKGVTDFADYFVICTGSSNRNIQAIADGIKEGLKAEKERPLHVEGYKDALWILQDYADVIVHVFTRETRDFFDLEHLWGDAKKLKFSSET